MSSRVTWLLFAFVFSSALPRGQAEIVDFEDLQLATNSHYVNNYQSGDATFQSGGATFNYNNEYIDTTLSPPLVVWAGWSYANTPQPAIPSLGGPGDYAHQYEADASSGSRGSSNYAMGYYDPFNNVVPTITLPEGEHPVSVQITNSTFTALAIQYYDGYTPVFQPADWFQLTITGYDTAQQVVGTVPVELADYRNGTLQILDHWTNVNLSSLYNAQTLAFTFTSSQNNSPDHTDPVGILTPTYVAIDDLSLTRQVGDANDDGIVNGQDLALASSAWLNSGPVADVNGDGIVNAQDIASMSSNWLTAAGTGNSAATAVPEPTTAVLAALGVVLLVAGTKLRR